MKLFFELQCIEMKKVDQFGLDEIVLCLFVLDWFIFFEDLWCSNYVLEDMGMLFIDFLYLEDIIQYNFIIQEMD